MAHQVISRERIVVGPEFRKEEARLTRISNAELVRADRSMFNNPKRIPGDTELIIGDGASVAIAETPDTIIFANGKLMDRVKEVGLMLERDLGAPI